MKDRNFCSLGWIGPADGSKQMNFGVRWSKKDRLWGLALIGAFTLVGVSAYLACKDAYFTGAKAAEIAEEEVLAQLGLIERV